MSIIYLCFVYSAYAVSLAHNFEYYFFLYASLWTAPWASVFGTVIVPLTIIYASL